MSLLDRFRGGVVEAMTDDSTALDALQEQLVAEQETTLLLQESIAELEADNRGWLALDTLGQQLQFTLQGLKEIAASARLNWLANPLIQRAVNVRMFYTWGQGVEVSARDGDINVVVQTFMDDPLNQQVLFGHDARQDKDRAVQLDGNLFLALVTSPLTGQVQLRAVPWAEITRVISNPEDREDRWFYQREWSTVVVDPVTGGIRNEPRKQFYPALGYRPATRAKSLGQFPIAWDSPVLHVRVGGLDGMDFGVSEVYSVLAWARAHKGFLEDWASLAKALSRFAWKGKTRPGRAGAMRQAIEEPGTVPGVRGGPGAGQAFVASNDVTDLTPISKAGATLDADSARPLAMMVAAGMDIPYTILMGDADVGNLATAKTLDRPTELAMQSRREMWAGIYRTVLGYVVQEAVRAPQGELRGTIRRDERGREVLAFAGDVDGNIDIEWPSILEHDIKELVDALVAADGTRHVPAEIICRLLLTALGVENVDEVMAELVDADGHFLDPALAAQARAGVAAAQQGTAGQDASSA